MTLKSKVANNIQSRRDYAFARARDLAFDAVVELWRRRQSAGLKQVDFAERLGRDTGWLSKKLSGPSNWTLRTFGEMVDALDGELEIRAVPLEEPPQPKRNFDAYAAKVETSQGPQKNHEDKTSSSSTMQFSLEEA